MNTGIQEYRALHWLLGLPLCLYPGAECSEVQWYSATVLHCYSATGVQWYCGTVVRWYCGIVLQCYSGTVLQGYSATGVQCYIGTVLRGAVLQGNSATGIKLCGPVVRCLRPIRTGMEDESTCYCSLVQQGQGRVAVQGSEGQCRAVQGRLVG